MDLGLNLSIATVCLYDSEKGEEPTDENFLLLEDDDFLLLEDGDKILLD